MKTIYYIIYKIINNLLVDIQFTNTLPLIFSKNDININSKELIFDISHSTTHLGDRLFLINLLRVLLENNFKLQIIDNSDFSIFNLYQMIYGESIPQHICNGDSLVIILKSSFLSKRRLYKTILVIDFTNIDCIGKISIVIANSFLSFFKLNVNYRSHTSKFSFVNNSNSIYGDNLIIFNNYLHSGKFRKYFLNTNILNMKCEQLKSSGYKIIHVGSSEDKSHDHNLYPFVDLDLRGKIAIEELIKLIGSKSVVGVVTYDNFIMHVSLASNKITWVLFRGRFTRTQQYHHINNVNNTFDSSNRNLIYLRLLKNFPPEVN